MLCYATSCLASPDSICCPSFLQHPCLVLHRSAALAHDNCTFKCNFTVQLSNNVLKSKLAAFFFSQKRCVYSYWKESFCTDKRRKFFHLLVHSPNSQSDQSFILYMQKCNYKTTREIHFFSFLLTF